MSTILVVNVNTSTAVTDVIAAAARAAVSATTRVVALTPTFGPLSVESNYESYLSAVGVLDVVQRYEGSGGEFNAVVHAGFGEVGREALQDVLTVPVVDITEAAAHTACLLGRSFGVVTSLDRAAPAIHDRLLLAGLAGRCAGIRSVDLPVLDLEADPELTAKAFLEQSRRLVEEGAEVICLGCAGMSGLHETLADALDVPVVDGVAAAARLAESLVGLGLSTSKVRSYAAPRAKPVHGWPLGG